MVRQGGGVGARGRGGSRAHHPEAPPPGGPGLSPRSAWPASAAAAVPAAAGAVAPWWRAGPAAGLRLCWASPPPGPAPPAAPPRPARPGPAPRAVLPRPLGARPDPRVPACRRRSSRAGCAAPLQPARRNRPWLHEVFEKNQAKGKVAGSPRSSKMQGPGEEDSVSWGGTRGSRWPSGESPVHPGRAAEPGGARLHRCARLRAFEPRPAARN